MDRLWHQLKCSQILVPVHLIGISSTFDFIQTHTFIIASVSARACLAKYLSLLIFSSKASGTSGTRKSINLHIPNTTCWNLYGAWKLLQCYVLIKMQKLACMGLKTCVENNLYNYMLLIYNLFILLKWNTYISRYLVRFIYVAYLE